jgi:hypothetical protein
MDSEILKSIIESIDESIEVSTYYNINKLTIIDENKIFRNKILPLLIQSDTEMQIGLYNYGVELDFKFEYVNMFYKELTQIINKIN